MEESLEKLYAAAGYAPYPYQMRFAREPWPDIVRVPTGMGKTAALFFAWLLHRLNGTAPRRLVWCLPMRVLVEQIAEQAECWLKALVEKKQWTGERPTVYRLMGGHTHALWSADPEKAAVIVGTQDQLLSRALLRGYGMSRYRWPMDFSLLHNDCLWVFDEVQLMGAGLSTSVQLHAFRKHFGQIFPCKSIWCSATMRQDWLNTTDFSAKDLRMLELSQKDKGVAASRRRLEARKEVIANKVMDAQEWATLILKEHRPGTRTLAVCNTVQAARTLFDVLKKQNPAADLVLLHSRFRAPERNLNLQRLLGQPQEAGTIAVTTQVVEAGVDVSAATLFTDLAPWPSLVQRFGRCNRAGEFANAKIFWKDKNKKDASPYDERELACARDMLAKLDDAAPASLLEVRGHPPLTPLLRKQDFLDLFDTTPDISGAHMDISRYIREGKDCDVRVYWRELPDGMPEAQTSAPHADELCAVPTHMARDFRTAGHRIWHWDALEERWTEPEVIYPGMILLLNCASGGYSAEQGWLGADGRASVPVVEMADRALPESDARDSPGAWQSLEEHARRCLWQMEDLLQILGAPLATWVKDLIVAAWLHDWGKAHHVFQTAMKDSPPGKTLWAKAPLLDRYERIGFRHELASALAVMQSPHEDHTDLAAYLVAAHHGRVRLSIRSLPHEVAPDDHTRFARGIYEGDQLLPALGQQETRLSLACMELGRGQHGDSWLQRTLTLLDTLGPFRLAYLETLLRVADWRASAEQDEAPTAAGGSHA